MKKAIISLAAGLILLVCMPAFSQAQKYPKDAYVKTVPIVKIYTHPLGYRVVYFKSNSTLADFYIPLSWFTPEVNQAQLVWGNSPQFPYLSIFWVDGKFDHVKLGVVDNFHSLTWGVLDPGLDLKTQFDVKEPPKDF